MKISKIILAVASCGIFALSANADHRWSTYHWATGGDGNTPMLVDLPAVSKISSDWNNEYIDSLNDWEKSNNIAHNTRETGSSSRKDRKRCTAIQGKLVTCNAAYGANGWAGLASINLDTNGHITQGTAKMNDTYLANDSYDYRLHVMCQEIGHVYGLGHTSEDGTSQQTCMDYSNDPRSTLSNSHDWAELALMYDHNDGYTTVAGGGSTSDPKPCRGGPKKCGSSNGAVPAPKVKITGNGKSQIWVSPGANGSTWIHHITLAKGFTDIVHGEDEHH